nr:hypothetical protein [Tanacetum cinerariifolium]
MEFVFHINNCTAENQVKFATCTLYSVALTWMFFKESDNVEKYVGGLPDMIHGSVVASKPKTMQEAIEIATELMDKKRGTELGQKPTCYECGVKGHYKRECPKLKNNNNQGNQGRRNNALARVYSVGRAGTDPDANVIT